MIKKFVTTTFIFCLCFSIQAKIDINVGGYIFPPYVYNEKNQAKGITIDLLNLINKSQDKYHFKFTLTSSKRRYKDFEKNIYDLIFFENLKWGWEDYAIKSTQSILKGGEVFIAHKKPGRTQKYFENLKDKHILGILGYHYKFANFISDRKYLKENFNTELRTNHAANIIAISKRDLPQVAIVTKSLLNIYLNKNPEYRNKIIISEKLDQVYDHRILYRDESIIKEKEIKDILIQLEKDGSLHKLWKQYSIAPLDYVKIAPN